MCNRRCRLLVRGSPGPSYLSASVLASSGCRSPTNCFAGTSSHELRVLCRALALHTRPERRAVTREASEHLPWGFFPHRDVNRQRPHLRAASKPPASFRPRRSSRPRRFAPLPALQVCFTPQPRPGFALQGFAPPPRPYGLVARLCPRVVEPPRLQARVAPFLRQLDGPRLQGLAPHRSLQSLRQCYPTPDRLPS
jgi:hypothetical protein